MADQPPSDSDVIPRWWQWIRFPYQGTLQSYELKTMMVNRPTSTNTGTTNAIPLCGISCHSQMWCNCSWFRYIVWCIAAPSGQSKELWVYFYFSGLFSWSPSLCSNCTEGTCDGCSFHFLWRSQYACPLCSEKNYKEIVSACINGIQVGLIHKIIMNKRHSNNIWPLMLRMWCPGTSRGLWHVVTLVL